MRLYVVVVSMAVLCWGLCLADAPKLDKGVRVEVNEAPIDIEVGHLVPDAVDFNGDGKKDLVVGQFKEGCIRLYVNEGTDAAPVFKEGKPLEAVGQVIKLDAG